MILFSVIIPVYNIEKYLKRSVNSILSQNYENYEIILVNDGSTDNSGKICEEFAKKSSKVKFINIKNSGVAVARNEGIKKAKGDYILFLDGDDFFKTTIFHDCEEAIIKNKSDIVVFGYNKITENDEIFNEIIPEKNYKLVDLLNSSYELTMLLWNKVYSRKLFSKIDLSSLNGITFSEDSYLTTLLLCQTAKISFIDRSEYNYLYRESSVTHKRNIKNLEDELRATYLIAQIPNEELHSSKALKIKMFNAKYFLISWDNDFNYKKFKVSIKKWKKIFPESNDFWQKKILSKTHYLYYSLIRKNLIRSAYFLYRLRKWRLK